MRHNLESQTAGGRRSIRRTTAPDTHSAARRARRTALAVLLIGGLVATPAVLATSAANAAMPAGETLSTVARVPAASPSVLETYTGFVLSGWKTWPPGSPNAYPIEAIATVDVYNTDNRVERATGKVAFFLDGAQYGPEVGVDVEGVARMTMPTDKVGTYQVSARYTGTSTQAPSTSRTQEYIVQPRIEVPDYPQKPVKSNVKASFTKLSKHRVKAKIVVSATQPASGKIEIRYGSKVVAKGTLKRGVKSIRLTTQKLKKGKRKLTVRYLGSSTVKASSKSYRVHVR